MTILKMGLSLLMGTMLMAQDARATESVIDVNVGFEFNKGPVSRHRRECLADQEVFGTTTTIWMGAAVEPSIAVNPTSRKHIVAAWQQDRINNGGSLEIGIARSHDGGKKWHHTTVPIQVCNNGTNQRASDVWLSWSKDGKTLYMTILGANATFDAYSPAQMAILVTTSKDNGETWSKPQVIIRSDLVLNNFAPPYEDKCSITASIVHHSRAFLVWDHFLSGNDFGSTTFLSRTKDNGKTWSAPVSIYDPTPDLFLSGLSNGIANDAGTIGNVIVTLPKDKDKHDKRKSGDILNCMTRFYATPHATDDDYLNDSFPFQNSANDIALIRSHNEGETWSQSATVIATPDINTCVFTGGFTYDTYGNVTGGVGVPLRTASSSAGPAPAALASFAVNHKNGNLYAVWEDNRFSPLGYANIALSTSRDGGYTWSEPVMVNRTPQDVPNPQAFTPSVAVTKEGRVGVLYCDFRHDDMCDPYNRTLTDVWLAVYKEVDDRHGGNTQVGLDFHKEVRLSKDSYIAQNGPSTSLGVMTNGDYSFLVADKKRFYAAYTQTFKGPFKEPKVIVNDENNDATVLLDDNHRQDPFVSVVNQ